MNADRPDPGPEGLPFIDEHRQRVVASADAVWTALLHVLRRQMGGSAGFARILGCDPSRGTAEFGGQPGEAIPGFRIAEAEPGQRLTLRGCHRFSNYALTFVRDGDSLVAQTYAVFPGVLGRLYRTAVIESGVHKLVTRRLLRQVARASARYDRYPRRRRMILFKHKLIKGNHFVAMEYNRLILNRTLLILLAEPYMVGVVARGHVNARSIDGDVHDPYSYLGIEYKFGSSQWSQVDLRSDGFLERNRANFRVQFDDISEVKFNPRRKWGMGRYPHDGRVYVTMRGTRREFIILGDQSGADIAGWIQNHRAAARGAT